MTKSTQDVPHDLQLLDLEAGTTFVISDAGRIVRENDPDRSLGPRLYFAGCADGDVTRLRHDVGDKTALRLLAVAAGEPPWCDGDAPPRCLAKFVELLAREQPVSRTELGVIFRLPNDLRHDHGASIVRSDSKDGAQLVARFTERGMPQPMRDAGFGSVGDLWPPWCIAREGEEVASIAFAARLTENGAAIGVYSFPKFRGRGFAAAVTASWSSLASLKDRTLFYGARSDNRSSRRVAARLGLRRMGASLRVE